MLKEMPVMSTLFSKLDQRVLLFVFLFAGSSVAGNAQELLQQDKKYGLVEAIKSTMSWNDQLVLYDLKLDIRRHHSSGKLFVDLVQMLRESFDSTKNEFYITRVLGHAYLEVESGRMRDELRFEYVNGNSKGAASHRDSVQGEAATISCGGRRSCVDTARRFNFAILPLTFALPIASNEEMTNSEEMLEFFLQLKSYESKEITVDDEKVTRYSVVRGVVASEQSIKLGYEVDVAKNGLAKGRIVAMRYGFVKPKVEKLLKKEDWEYIDRTIRIIWQSVETEPEKFVVLPLSVRKKYLLRDGSTELSEDSNYDWISIGKPIDDVSTDEFRERMAKEMGEKVNRVMNR
jgi:hypothetical protein